MIPRLGRTPNDQFTLKGAKRVQADHAGTWWGGVGWNPLWGLLSRGDVGQDVQGREYSFLQNLGLHIIFHIEFECSKFIAPSRIYFPAYFPSTLEKGDLMIKAIKMKIVGLNLFPPNVLNAPCSYSMDHPKTRWLTISFASGPKAGPRNWGYEWTAKGLYCM